MGAFIGRILVAVMVVAAGLFAARTVADGLRDATRSADPKRYRPRGGRARTAAGAGPDGPRASRSILRRAAVGQLRDALSGAPLSPDDDLFRCAGCQSFYTAASVRALANENGARCLHCGSIERMNVEVVA